MFIHGYIREADLNLQNVVPVKSPSKFLLVCIHLQAICQFSGQSQR